MWIPIRIEQIAIGTAVNGTNLPPEARYLRAEDFSYSTGVAVFAAVASVRAANPHLDALQVATQCAPKLIEHLVSGQALLAYAAMAAQVNPDHVALAHRELLRHGADADIDRARNRVTTWTTDKYKQPDAKQLAELGDAAGDLHRAVHRRTQVLDWLAPDEEGAVSDLWYDWFDHWTAPLAPDHADTQWLDAEKTILAGLIQHPQALWTIGPWLDFSSFSVPLHQDAFDTMLYLGGDFAEGSDQLRSLSFSLNGAQRTASNTPAATPAIRKQELLELAAIAAVPTSAMDCVIAARDLVARDTSESLRHQAIISTQRPQTPEPPDGPMLPPPGTGPHLRI